MSMFNYPQLVSFFVPLFPLLIPTHKHKAMFSLSLSLWLVFLLVVYLQTGDVDRIPHFINEKNENVTLGLRTKRKSVYDNYRAGSER